MTFSSLHSAARLLFVLSFLATIGCQSIDWGLQGNALLTKTINCPDYHRIESALTEEMARIGYTPAAGHPQAEGFALAKPRSLSNRVISFFHGGQDSIWFVAQPEDGGWTIYCMVEPSGYDTHFPRHRLKGLLARVEEKCRS